MKISLIKYADGKTLSVGQFSFPIENGLPQHSQSSRIGCEMKGPRSLKEYDEAFDLALFSWEAQEFDEVIENVRA